MDPLDRQVLILDDETGFAEAARTALRQLATRVKVAGGAGALTAARATRWDLIVCAVELPPLGGPELRRQLSADPTLAGVPFLFVGQGAPGADLPTGADAPLPKPVDPETLLARARRLLVPASPPTPAGRVPTGQVNAVGRKERSGQYATAARVATGQVAAIARKERSGQYGAVVGGGKERSGTFGAVSGTGPIRIDAPGQLSGGLDTFAMADVLQMLEAGRSTGILAITGKALAGELVLRDGKVMVARTNHRSGEDAALRLIWLREGHFEFEKLSEVDAPEGPGWSIGRLLMDAAWLFDELTRLGERAPGVTDRIEIVDPPAALAAFPQNAAWKAMVAARRGPFVVQDLAAQLGVSTYRCRAILGKSAEQGALNVVPGPPAI